MKVPHGLGEARIQHSGEADTTSLALPCPCGCALGAFCLTTATGNFKALLCRSRATLFRLDMAVQG